jgi:hypothetical protein
MKKKQNKQTTNKVFYFDSLFKSLFNINLTKTKTNGSLLIN